MVAGRIQRLPEGMPAQLRTPARPGKAPRGSPGTVNRSRQITSRRTTGPVVRGPLFVGSASTCRPMCREGRRKATRQDHTTGRLKLHSKGDVSGGTGPQVHPTARRYSRSHIACQFGASIVVKRKVPPLDAVSRLTSAGIALLISDRERLRPPGLRIPPRESPGKLHLLGVGFGLDPTIDLPFPQPDDFDPSTQECPDHRHGDHRIPEPEARGSQGRPLDALSRDLRIVAQPHGPDGGGSAACSETSIRTGIVSSRPGTLFVGGNAVASSVGTMRAGI